MGHCHGFLCYQRRIVPQFVRRCPGRQFDNFPSMSMYRDARRGLKLYFTEYRCCIRRSSAKVLPVEGNRYDDCPVSCGNNYQVGNGITGKRHRIFREHDSCQARIPFQGRFLSKYAPEFDFNILISLLPSIIRPTLKLFITLFRCNTISV